MNIRIYIIFIAAFLISAKAFSQESERKVIQFSGIVQGEDQQRPLPFTTIRIKNTSRGTISDFDGFFSMPVQENDTVVFTSIGYKRAAIVIPSNLTSGRYTIVQRMELDTIMLDETVVYPWPTPEQFRDAFLALQVPEDDMDRARRNLDQDLLMAINQGMSMSGSENQKYYLQSMARSYYYAGGQPMYTEMGGMRIPNTLLDPFAWSRFFRAMKAGEFNRRE